MGCQHAAVAILLCILSQVVIICRPRNAKQFRLLRKSMLKSENHFYGHLYGNEQVLPIFI